MSYSFWADEAYIAGVAAQWIIVQQPFLTALNATGLTYQRFQMLFVGIFFKLFGISEFSARLPSLLFFIVGIISIFFLARKLSSVYGGVLGAFLYTFSHLNLSYATQAKPYAALETITLLVILLISFLDQEKQKRKIMLFHTSIICFLCAATFLHVIGVFLWSLYFVYIVSTLKRNVQTLKRVNVLTVLITLFLLSLISFVLLPYTSYKLLPYNHWYQAMKLFCFKYSLICTCAALGFVLSFNKNKALNIAILVYSMLIFVLATFQQYIFNIRYVLTLFGIMFLYFGIFWAKVGERLDSNFKFEIPFFTKASKGKFNFKLSGKVLIPIGVILLIYITGYKIVKFPQAYYNPNIDKYGDVQIANYKDFYGELKARFPNYQELYVVNDTFDVEYWYFGRYSNAYFMKFTPKPYKHHTVDAFVYGSLSDFKKIMKEHPQGLFIMEDWQSFLPDDVKAYTKKNLKLEFRIESLKEAQDDPWPLALYSWGL